MPEVELLGDIESTSDLPDADILLIKSLDFVGDNLGKKWKCEHPILLLSDDPEEVERLRGMPVWGALTLNASPD
jgi:hypothetical protein